MKLLKLLKRILLSHDKSDPIVDRITKNQNKIFELEVENKKLIKQVTNDIPIISQLESIFEPVLKYIKSELDTLLALEINCKMQYEDGILAYTIIVTGLKKDSITISYPPILLYEYAEYGIVSEMACNRRLTDFKLSCAARDFLLNQIERECRGYMINLTSKDEPIDRLINPKTKNCTKVVMPAVWLNENAPNNS